MTSPCLLSLITAEPYYFAHLIYGNLLIHSYQPYEGRTFNHPNFLKDGTGSVVGRSVFVERLQCLSMGLHPQDDKPHMGNLVS